MTALEQELIDRFAKLDLETKQRLLAQIESESQASEFEQLMQEMDEFREGLLVKYGSGHFVSVADMVREVREEHEDDLMGCC